MKLAANPAVAKLMQDERFMQLVMTAMSMPGQGADLHRRAEREFAKAMGLATQDEVKRPEAHRRRARARGHAPPRGDSRSPSAAARRSGGNSRRRGPGSIRKRETAATAHGHGHGRSPGRGRGRRPIYREPIALPGSARG